MRKLFVAIILVISLNACCFYDSNYMQEKSQSIENEEDVDTSELYNDESLQEESSDSCSSKVSIDSLFTQEEINAAYRATSLKKYLEEQYDIKEPQKVAIGDHTGKWRIQKVANSTPPSEYAIDYARAYMKDGDVHYIINFSLKTTTRLNLGYNVLSVVTTEYHDNEEHNAETLGNGMIYSEKYYDLETGKELS